MKLRLPKALTAALLAGMVGNFSVSGLRAESVVLTSTQVTNDTSLVYYNSFDTVKKDGANLFGSNALTSTSGTGATTSGASVKSVAGNMGNLFNAAETVEGYSQATGFTMSIDLSSATVAAWQDLLSVESGTKKLIHVQSDGSTLQLYGDTFAGATGRQNTPNDTNVGVAPGNLNNTTITLTYEYTSNTTGTLKVYVDGALTLTSVYTGTNLTQNITGIAIGDSYSDAKRANSSATLDNLAIWNKALTAAEVQDLTILKWTGAEGTSTTWATLNNNIATRTQVKATVTPTATEGDAATWTFGAAGSAVEAGITDFTVSGGALKMDVAAGSSLALGAAHVTDGGALTVSGNATVGKVQLAADTTLTLDVNKELSFTSTTMSLASGAKVKLGDGTSIMQTDENYTISNREGVDGYVAGTLGSLFSNNVTVNNMTITFNANRYVSAADLRGSDVITDNNSSNDATWGTRFMSAQSLNSLTVNGNTWVEADMSIAQGLTVASGKTLTVNIGEGERTLTLNGAADVSAGKLDIKSGNIVNVGATGSLTLAADDTHLSNAGTISIADGGLLYLANATTDTHTVGTLSFTGDISNIIAGIGHRTASYDSTSGIITLTGEFGAHDLTWAAADNGSSWSNARADNNWTSSDFFANGDSVTFDSTADGKEVTVVGDVSANNMTVTDAYTFSGGNISVTGQLQVNNGSLTLDGNNLTTGTISVSGEATLAATNGGSLTYTGISFGTGATQLTLYGVDATFSADNTMTVEGSTLNVSGGATVKLQAGTAGSSGTILQNTTVTVDKATLEMNKDALGWASHGNTIILTSDDADNLAVLKNTAGNDSNTFCMDIQMQGNSRISGGKFNTYGVDFTVSGTNNIVESEMQVRNSTQVTLVDGAALTFAKLSNNPYGGEAVGTMTISGSGAVTVNALGDGFNRNVVVEGGSLTLNTVQGATADLSTFKTETNGTLKLKLSTDAAGSKVTLNNASSGSLEVLSGTINFAATNPSSIGTSKLILDNNTTLCFAISGNSNSIKVTNDIDVKGAVDLRAYGATDNTAANTLSGTIKGGAGSSIRKTDGGDITLTGDVNVDTVYVAAGNLILGNGNTTSATHVRLSENGAAGNTLRIDEGATLTLTEEPDNSHDKTASLVLAHWSQAGYLVVAGGTLEAANVKALMSWDGTGTMKIQSGTAKLQGLSFLAHSGFKGNFELGDETTASNAVLEIGGAGFENVGGDASIKLGNGTIKLAADSKIAYDTDDTDFSAGTVQLVGTNGGTVFDTNSHNFTINTLNVTGGGDLVKKSAGELTFGQQLVAGHITVEAGTLNLNGATTITSTIINDDTIAFGTGASLTVADLEGLTKSGTATYSDATASDNVNGYANATYILVKSATDGNDTTVTGLEGMTVNGMAVTKSENEYILRSNGTSGAYYINDGTVIYNTGSTANEIASTATTGIVLAGTTAKLDMETSLRDGVGVSVNASSTIAIGANAELNKTSVTLNNNSTLTLEGTGRYVITDANIAHSGSDNSLDGYLNATLGQDWNGVVKFQGGDFWGANIDSISSGAVELCGVKGMFKQADSGVNTGAHPAVTFQRDLILTNGTVDGVNAAFLFNSGWSGDDITFAGKVSGTGYMVRADGAGSVRQLRFTGDVSDWTGGYNRYDDNSHTKYTSNVFFTGNPLTEKDGVDEADRVVEIHANVDSRQGGTGEGKGRINLTVGNDNKVVYTGNIYIARNLSGKSNDGCGMLETSGTGAKAFEGTVNAEKLVADGGEVSFKQGATFGGATLTNKSADNLGTVKNVTIDGGHLTGATGGEGSNIQSLGEVTGLTLEAAAAMTVSNVTLYDSTINAGSSTITYSVADGSRVSAVVTSASATDTPQTQAYGLRVSRDSSATADSLTATTVQKGGTATGTLTVDVDSAFIGDNIGSTLTWKIFDGVTLDDFSLVFGAKLTEMINQGIPKVTLTINQDEAIRVTKDNISSFTTAGELAHFGTGGSLVLCIENIPEPTTGALSVLALAALAARRRRKKQN